MRIQSFQYRTGERVDLLREYMESEVLRDDTFVCKTARSCMGSLKQGLEFWEGQLSHVGHHFDLEIDGQPMRLMVVGKENGRGPARITLEQRYSAVHDFRASQAFSKRNPHMRGTTLALRMMLAGNVDTGAGGEYLTDTAGDRFHLFDAFALVNRILCSAVAPNSTDGRSTPTMRANCLRHFDATVRILEPTVVILQGAPMLEWIRPSVTDGERLGPNLIRARVSGVFDVLVASFAHPQARAPHTWSSPSDVYTRDVVVPTLQLARAQVGHDPSAAPAPHNMEKRSEPSSPEVTKREVPTDRWVLRDDELQRYLAWLGSSSASTPDSEEMRIAFVLARELGLHPTRTIRILRGQRGERIQAVRDRVESAVLSTPELTFVFDRNVRRVAFDRR